MTPDTSTTDTPPVRRPRVLALRARLLLMVGLALAVLLGAACDPGPQPIPPSLAQSISNVSATPLGTQIRVRFDTLLSTTKTRVEVWKGDQYGGMQLGQLSSPARSHDITVSSLDPATAYTVKVFAKKQDGTGQVSHTVPGTVTTLTRKLTITARYAQVQNDSDPGGCGELYGFFDLTRTSAGYPQHFWFGQTGSTYDDYDEVCGQTWDPADTPASFDDVTEEYVQVEAIAKDDDFPEVPEGAHGTTWLDLEAASGDFTRDVAIDLTPNAGDDLDMTWHLRYAVSYHA